MATLTQFLTYAVSRWATTNVKWHESRSLMFTNLDIRNTKTLVQLTCHVTVLLWGWPSRFGVLPPMHYNHSSTCKGRGEGETRNHTSVFCPGYTTQTQAKNSLEDTLGSQTTAPPLPLKHEDRWKTYGREHDTDDNNNNNDKVDYDWSETYRPRAAHTGWSEVPLCSSLSTCRSCGTSAPGRSGEGRAASE